jgi:hypothetical protein
MTYQFDPTQGLIVVPVRLFGPAGDIILRLALDTGATSTLINSEIMILLDTIRRHRPIASGGPPEVGSNSVPALRSARSKLSADQSEIS